MTVDTVTLTLPSRSAYLPLLHLVLGGIALRKDMSFDDLDDVQLAVDNLLAEDAADDCEIEVRVSLEPDGLRIRLGAFTDRDLRGSLRPDSLASAPGAPHLDMHVLLGRLCDTFVVEDLNGDSYAVELWKRTG